MIEVKISEKGTDRCEFVELPLRKDEFIDILDKAQIHGEYIVEISKICNGFGVLNIQQSETLAIDELNFLAKRIDEISKDNCTAIAYNAVISQHESVSISEAINATYGLETVTVYPCNDAAEYGEVVLDNEMLDELKDVSDEIYDLLDREKIGKLMQEREGGIFLKGYYVIPTAYEQQPVYDNVLPSKTENASGSPTIFI